MHDITVLKRQAAEDAVAFISSGMVVGLGTGSTAIHALRRIAERLKTGDLQDILGVPTSEHIAHEARQLGVPLTTLEDNPVIDLTIDGADEVDPNLDLIKGGGGALLREKIVAQASRREIIVVDESKRVPQLGTHWAIPVEVVPFGWRTQADFVQVLGAQVTLRRGEDGTPFLTDQGNLILDCNFGPLPDPGLLAVQLSTRVGIVEHGLFLGLATDVIVAGETGLTHLKRA